MKKLEKLKGLMAHQNFEGRYDRLIELLADLALKKLEPAEGREKKGEKRGGKVGSSGSVQNSKDSVQLSVSPAETSPEASSTDCRARRRYIRASIRRAVHLRDEGQCTFIDLASGRRCASRHGLQFDHSPVPFSLGGENTTENLTLRCAAHNRYLAEKMGLGQASFASSLSSDELRPSNALPALAMTGRFPRAEPSGLLPAHIPNGIDLKSGDLRQGIDQALHNQNLGIAAGVIIGKT